MPENKQINILQSLKHSALTDVGMRRKENQDNFGEVFTDGYRCYIVADGMGGAKGGATASKLAIEVINKHLTDLQEITPKLINDVLTLSNEKIFTKSLENKQLTGMGTTCVMLVFTKQKLYIANVGDSRAYRIRNNQIEQLTEDHTLINELLKSGILKEENAENHPVAHMLTRCLGPAAAVDIDCFLDVPGPLEGDKYLLCSDGLYNMVKDEEILEYVEKYDIKTATQKLVDLANERGGTDNVTVYMVEVFESPHIASPDVKYEIVPVSFANPTVEGHSDTYEKLLMRHSAAIDRYGIESKQSAFRTYLVITMLFVTVAFFYYSYRTNQKSWQVTEASQGKVNYQDLYSRFALSGSVEPLKTIELPIVELTDDQKKKIELEERKRMQENDFDLEIYQDYLHNEIAELEAESEAVLAKLKAVNTNLMRSYSYMKLFEEEGALKLAGLMSSKSSVIKKQLNEFEEASWEYSQILNESSEKPQDQTTQARLSEQLKKRKDALQILELKIYSTIQEIIGENSRNLQLLQKTLTNKVGQIEVAEYRLDLHD